MNRQLFNNKEILVVEDDRDEQEFLLMAFKEERPDYHITCMDNGKSSFYYLQQLKDDELPSLIILDYNMPGWNGSDVLHQLQQMPRLKNIPVVVYSTSGSFHNKTTTGARAFIEKATTWQGIKQNIRDFLSYKQELAIS